MSAFGATGSLAIAAVSGAAAGSTPVSNSFGIIEEALSARATSAPIVDESVASATALQAVIEELLASLTLVATPKEEALQAIALTATAIAEAKQTATGAFTPVEEATGLTAANVSGPDAPDFEARATAVSSPAVISEATGLLNPSQAVGQEALLGIAPSMTAPSEALTGPVQAPGLTFESKGIVILPVSNDVVVQLESQVLTISSTGINARLATLSPITALIGPATPVFDAGLGATPAILAALVAEQDRA